MVLDQLEPKELAAAVAELESDDAIDLIEDLEADQQREILDNLPPETRALVEEGLTFPEDSAGRLMSRDLVSVPQFWTVGKTLDYLRTEADTLPEDFYDIFIVDPMRRVVGAVPVSRVMRQKRSVRLADILTEDIRTVQATTDQEEVAFLFRQYGLVSAPVVDAAGRLLGVITVDDVVDVIDEEAEDDLLKLSGVPDTDIYRAVLDTTRSRFSWLFVNLLTAILASGVISMFEATIEHIVALGRADAHRRLDGRQCRHPDADRGGQGACHARIVGSQRAARGRQGGADRDHQRRALRRDRRSSWPGCGSAIT